MVTKVRVKKGLHSFLDEIGRFSFTSGFHYAVVDKGTIEVIHHENKWRVVVGTGKIVVTTDNDELVITKTTMALNGREVDMICNTTRCFSANEVAEKVIFAIAIYRANVPKWLYRWISG